MFNFLIIFLSAAFFLANTYLFCYSYEMEKIKKIKNISNYMVFATIFIIWFIFSILTKGVFLSPRNISNIFLQMTIISYISMGMAFVIISGNIDLSVGSLVGLTGGVIALLQVRFLSGILQEIGFSGIWITIITIIITLIFGGLIGLWQGLWISYGKIPSIIVTLAGMLMFRGAVLLFTKGITLTPMSISLRYLGQGHLTKPMGYILSAVILIGLWLNTYLKYRYIKNLKKPKKQFSINIIISSLISIFIIIFTLIFNTYKGFPIPVVIMFLLAIFLDFLAKHTPFGKYTYAIGGSKESSKLLGIDIKKNQLMIFILMGILTAISGIIITARVNAGTTNAGMFFEIETIAACVIGGISLFGGRGSIYGALIGALIIASIDNGMSMMNLEISWQYIIKGMIIILMVWLDVNLRKIK